MCCWTRWVPSRRPECARRLSNKAPSTPRNSDGWSTNSFTALPPPSTAKTSNDETSTGKPAQPPAAESRRQDKPPCGEKPFHFLRETPGDKLAEVLLKERPQTIAIVLSHLDQGQAGDLLVRFPATLQVEVVRRLVDLEEADPEILTDVETALRTRLSQTRTAQRRKTAGMSAVAGILKASNGDVGGQILDTLARHDHALAEKLGPKPLRFDDLVHLDNETWTLILQSSEPDVAILALTGAPDQLTHRILAGLPERESQAIRRHLDHLGPTRLSDVEEAQRRIAHTAWRLATSGRISLPHKPCRPAAAAATHYAQWA